MIAQFLANLRQRLSELATPMRDGEGPARFRALFRCQLHQQNGPANRS